MIIDGTTSFSPCSWVPWVKEHTLFVARLLFTYIFEMLLSTKCKLEYTTQDGGSDGKMGNVVKSVVHVVVD